MNFSIRNTAVYVNLISCWWLMFLIFDMGFLLGLAIFQSPVGGIVTAFITLTVIAVTHILHEVAHAVTGIYFGKEVEHIYFGRTSMHIDAPTGAHVLFVESEDVIPVWQDVSISLAAIVVDAISVLSLGGLAALSLELGNTKIAVFIAILALFELGIMLGDIFTGDGKDIRNLLKQLKN